MPEVVAASRPSKRSGQQPNSSLCSKSVVEPLAYTIPSAIQTSGFSRTRIYDLLASGDLAAFKAGRRTMIYGDSLRACVKSLPPATFRAPKGRAAGKAL